MRDNILGNPHSTNPTSALSSKLEEECRAEVVFAALNPNDYTINELALRRELEKPGHKKWTSNARLDNKLFAFSAQSNATGAKCSLDWIKVAKSNGWRVLLDAAAFVPTNRLDLSVYSPDFVALSFYKMFGFPTGVGALLVHNSALPLLAKRPWFAGGTIKFATQFMRVLYPSLSHKRYEDGTIAFNLLPAVTIGLRHVDRIGIETINTHVTALCSWVLEGMSKMIHPSTGQQLCQVYGPGSGSDRGSTILFNLRGRKGELIHHSVVQEAASRRGISMRASCNCNSGIFSTRDTDKITKENLKAAMKLYNGSDLSNMDDGAGKLLDIFLKSGQEYAYGYLRASFGIASNFSDAFSLIEFLHEFIGSFLDATMVVKNYEDYPYPESFC